MKRFEALAFDLHGTLWTGDSSQNHPWPLFPEVETTLKKAAESFPLFLISSSPQDEIDDFIDFYNFRPFFRKVISSQSFSGGKRDALLTVKKSDNIKKLVYLGDTYADQVATYQAQSVFAFASWGHGQARVSCPRFKSLKEFLVFCTDPISLELKIQPLLLSEWTEAEKFYRSMGYHKPLQNVTTLVVAKNGNTVIGVVRIQQEHEVLVLRGMHIAPEYQGLGVGQKMLQSIKDSLTKPCFCLAHSWLLNFYGEIGFRRVLDPRGAPDFLIQRLKEGASEFPHLILLQKP